MANIPKSVFLGSLLKAALQHGISMAAYVAYEENGKQVVKLRSNVGEGPTKAFLAMMNQLDENAAADALHDELRKLTGTCAICTAVDVVGTAAWHQLSDAARQRHADLVRVVLEVARSSRPIVVDRDAPAV
jgi:hypothetical protein